MIQEKAMLVKLNISQWTGRKKDKKVTRETNAFYGASDASGYYSKALIPKEAVKPISQVVSNTRTFHYENTLPWGENGERLLPSKNYLDYTRKMHEFSNQFDDQVRIFLETYPELIRRAQETLNQMFNQEDYPDILKLETRFAFTTQITPVPSAADFRVDLARDEVSAIRRQIEHQARKAQAEAMASLWQRLYDVVAKMADRLEEEGAVFRDSLVNNIKDLAALLPKLNIAEDPDLERMTEHVTRRLCTIPPDVLRRDPAARKETADQASAVLRRMDYFMGEHAPREEAA
jgi:hypothetical protein